ncbi:MAG: two-component sensor histidine kinase [Deltaproteobacteria bacterium]|nr:two-component sensor histidine kinase [Deltaproteobacteria bacterium]
MSERQKKWFTPGRVLIGLALVMSIAVISTSVGNYLVVRTASARLVSAQAAALLDSIRAGLRQGDPGQPQALADELLNELSDRGLRYLALGNAPRVASGQARVIGQPISYRSRRMSLSAAGGRVLVKSSRRVWRARFRSAPLLGQLSRDISFEFEPTVARQISAYAWRGLWISGLVSLVMVGLAIAGGRWIRGQQALEQQLQRDRRLAALGEMSAVLAHEIRNPLASLKGHAQLMQELLAEGEPRLIKKTAQVVGDAERLERLVNELLEFVRTGNIDCQPADPRELVRALGSHYGERLQIKIERAPQRWRLDAARIERVLINLLDNALQASPIEQPVTLELAATEAELVITVADQGPGIAPGTEQSIFEPFSTGRTRGTGLGLAVARRIVEAHRGSISARNGARGGAIFELRIPADTTAG